jgi:two-component system CheB/CheR fusion protein
MTEKIRKRSHAPSKAARAHTTKATAMKTGPAGAAGPAASTGTGFPIVGIGASAGGLAAFEAFFSGMPADKNGFGKLTAGIGMAFVLVQHLAPDHKSILTELIRRYTRMQVFEVEDGMTVRHDCAYIIPPNRDMAFLNGSLQLLEPAAPRGQRLPIDFFFRSLAQDQRERAVCIVLSGTGSDGTLGVRAIKGEGGMVIVQNPESTEYDGMPRSAIATGLVDYVLPPAEMPARLMAYAAHAFGKIPRAVSSTSVKIEDELKKIFVLLRTQTGHDFSLYKQNTIIRRVERRMALHQIECMDGYIRYLQQNPAEVEALFRDLLIGVTSFFRDPEAFLALKEGIVTRLFAQKPSGALLRIWAPGCSTGEEAYSIAILLIEQMETLKRSFKLQVFATDIDSRAIETARGGNYPASISADVSPERLARFFTRDQNDSVYRINKNIRDMLVFSEQDVTKDPPFSKLDLISCRNLLIYMNGELQKKIIPLFHYALKPGGTLFLGTSETVGEFTDLFAPLDRKAKLYQRRENILAMRLPSIGTFLPPRAEGGDEPAPPEKFPGESTQHLCELTERAMLQQFAAAGALVNDCGDILYLHGRTGLYLEPAPGKSSMNILKMAREGLRRDLTTALHRAAAQKEAVRHAGLRVRTNGKFTMVNLTVRPVTAAPAGKFKAELVAGQALYLVILEEAPAAERKRAQNAGNGGADKNAHTSVAALKRQLRAKEEYLQTTNEELETSNEELRSSNEEMQSVNEELQSTNEELETAKEELHSVNEELSTVNAELQTKVADLTRANNDMNNLLAGTGIGTIFVDHHLCIQRFTPSVTQVINLILSDVGRPVGHIVSNLAGYDRLVEDVQEVLDTLVLKEVEVRTRTGAWYSLRIRPYRTLENVIEGAVITFFDITEIKQAQAALRENDAARRLAVVTRDAHDAILAQDLTGSILAWNPGAERMYGWTEAEALAMNIRDLIPEELRKEAFTVVQQLGRAEKLEPYRAQRMAKDGRIVEVWLAATALVNEAGDVYAISTIEREIKD